MKEKIHTRDKIMQVALELFSRNGYEGVSIMDITKEVGINKATFYSHYASKALLLKKIFDSFKNKIFIAGPKPEEYESLLRNKENRRKSGIENLLLEGLNLYLKKLTEPDMAQIIRLAQMEQYRNPSAHGFMNDFFYMLPFNIAEYLFKVSMKMKIIKDTDASLLAYEFESVLMYFLQEYILEDFYDGDVEAIKARMKEHIHFFCKKVLCIKGK
jgi:AcrR family transcriptional regulator